MKNLLTITVLLLVLLTSAASSKDFNAKEIKNLKVSLTSENDGVRKAAIYLAGKYQVKEVKDDLVKILLSQNDSNVKILAALALYRISDPTTMKEIKNAAVMENDLKTKNMLMAIYKEYKMNGAYAGL